MVPPSFALPVLGRKAALNDQNCSVGDCHLRFWLLQCQGDQLRLWLLEIGSVLLDRLHLDSDAVERLPRGVEYPSGWLRRHVHDQTSLTIPRLDRLYDIPVWRQLRTVWSKIMHWSPDLIEHED
jgi:hypothetical protein